MRVLPNQHERHIASPCRNNQNFIQLSDPSDTQIYLDNTEALSSSEPLIGDLAPGMHSISEPIPTVIQGLYSHDNDIEQHIADQHLELQPTNSPINEEDGFHANSEPIQYINKNNRKTNLWIFQDCAHAENHQIIK